MTRSKPLSRWTFPGLAVLLAWAWWLVARVHGTGPKGSEAPLLWAGLAVWCGLFWFVLDGLARLERPRPARLVAPALLGAGILFLWEVLVLGWEVPKVMLPAPAQVAVALVARWEVLWPDFLQTARAVLAGWAAGCSAGFAMALVADRFDFLRRGLLPLGGLAGAVPIVGIAPIMVMWFGFDWQSKAAVVVIMTFFPMLVSASAGLSSAGAMERDLMKTYGADYWQTLLKLRLPAALPFIFNALKINTTLAMIGAIVAEFFGTPTVGMGFRISTEVGHLGIDMVWATILVAALTGSLFYALVAWIERRATFWHASFRRKEA